MEQRRQSAERLGMDRSMLYQRRKNAEGKGSDVSRGKGNRAAADEELRLENCRLREQAEILRKASKPFAKHLK